MVDMYMYKDIVKITYKNYRAKLIYQKSGWDLQSKENGREYHI